jgi:hypothetical protein
MPSHNLSIRRETIDGDYLLVCTYTPLVNQLLALWSASAAGPLYSLYQADWARLAAYARAQLSHMNSARHKFTHAYSTA